MRLSERSLLAGLAAALAALMLMLSGSAAEEAPEDAEIEAILAGLSVEERVGQLLLAGYPGLDPAAASAAISELRAGGILLTNGLDAEAAGWTVDVLQAQAAASEVLPLMIAVDHEGGPVQRIRIGVSDLGSNADLGAIEPVEEAVRAACERGAIHGRELAELGIQMNLAPVLDVLDNPRNTVIEGRSYGSDPALVARLGAAYVEALQREDVLAVGKHWPGHGSSSEDSHLALPVIAHDRARLEATELVPFVAAMQSGLAGIMTAHVSYPLVDDEPGRPATFSPTLVQGLLREELGFSGLILTDDLGAMRSITDHYEPGEAAVRSLLAGSDVLAVVGPLSSQRRMVQAVIDAVGSEISEERLDESVRRVLRAKQRVGLLGDNRPARPIEPSNCPAA